MERNMKNLNKASLKQIAGGEKFFLMTSTIDIEGIPTSCIDRFFNASSNITLVGTLEDNLGSMLTSNCEEYQNFTGSHSHSYESNPVSLLLIEE